MLRRMTDAHKIIHMIESTFDGTTAYISGSDPDPGKSTLAIGAGVRQGSLESPALFNTFLAFLLRIDAQEAEDAGIKHGIEVVYKVNQPSLHPINVDSLQW